MLCSNVLTYCYYLFRLTSFTSVFVLVGNSALVSIVYVMSCVIITPPIQPATRGTVNGIGQSLVAIGRSTGPLIGAPLFAWSEGNGKIMCVCSIRVF